MAGTAGKSKISSTSNTRKIRAITKNRSENGRRAENLFENPHSKGLHFSRSAEDFKPRLTPTNNSVKGNNMIARLAVSRKIYKVLVVSLNKT